jgi:twitching motility protein PilU
VATGQSALFFDDLVTKLSEVLAFGGIMELKDYFKLVRTKNASDLFFIVGSPVRIKLEGEVVTVGKQVLNADMTRAIAHEIMTESQWRLFERDLEIDFAFHVPEEDVFFRVNAFTQMGHTALVMRYIRPRVPNLEELKLPDILPELIMRKRGLLLMVGATNSGKSTTLAAMLDYRNSHHAGHIITIEDPVEFVHSHKKSIISQREFGADTHSFNRALRSAMREAPDVILIGEIRDRDTMETALVLCNTGHLVVSTLHANNAAQAIQRIINLFPHERHPQLLADLATNLIAVLSQRLVMGVDDHRVAALEIMLGTPFISDLILNGRIDELKDAMLTSATKGMQSFDTALMLLYKQGRITMEEALKNADSRTNLEAKFHFG